MWRRMQCRYVVGLSLAIACLFVATGRAQQFPGGATPAHCADKCAACATVGTIEPQTISSEAERRAEERLSKALDQPTTAAFTDSPLEEALQFLSEARGIPIHADRKALEDLAIGTDSPINLQVEGVSLRSALRLMLRDLHLTFTPQDEVLLVTTPEVAGARLVVKLYPVRELLGTSNENFFNLVKVITSSIAPDSWDEVGGPGSIAPFGSNLVVGQTTEVHESIETLLATLCRFPGSAPPSANKTGACPTCGAQPAAKKVGGGGGQFRLPAEQKPAMHPLQILRGSGHMPARP